jgi:hypothetical protein
MYEFNELEWANKSLRGKSFGFHGKTFVYLPGRKAIIHVRTGDMSEVDVRFILGASIPGMGPQMLAVFAETPDAAPDDPTALNFNSMYMSQDGVDPLSKKKTGHPFIPRKPREDAALKPNTDYYLTLEYLGRGHSSVKHQIKVVYAGTDSPEDSVIVPSGMSMVIDGVPGTWTADE